MILKGEEKTSEHLLADCEKINVNIRWAAAL